MPQPLELWYEFASTYSYLTVSRIEAVAAAAKVPLVWKPFLLGPIFEAQGWNDSPFNLYEAKGRYTWRDMERLCEGYGLAFQRPSAFPRNGLLAARVALVAHERGFGPGFSRAVYHANFAEDLDIGDTRVIAGLIESFEFEAGEILEAADHADTKARLRAQTDEAVAAGIFGAPTLRVGDEIFWGNDRLGDAIAWSALGGGR